MEEELLPTMQEQYSFNAIVKLPNLQKTCSTRSLARNETLNTQYDLKAVHRNHVNLLIVGRYIVKREHTTKT